MGRTVQKIRNSESHVSLGAKKKVMKAPKSAILVLKSNLHQDKKIRISKKPLASSTDATTDATATAADGTQKRRKMRIRPSKAYQRLMIEEYHPAPIFPRASFDRLIREILQEHDTRVEGGGGFRISRRSVDALMEGAKTHLIEHFRGAALLTHHAGRTTTMPKDMQAWQAANRVRENCHDLGAHTPQSADYEREIEMKKRNCNYWTTTDKNFKKRLNKPIVNDQNISHVEFLIRQLKKNASTTSESASAQEAVPLLAAGETPKPAEDDSDSAEGESDVADAF